MRGTLAGWLAIAVLCAIGSAPAGAQRVELPKADEVERAFPEGAMLSGRDIWDRFLGNRLRTSLARMRIISADPSGDTQEVVLFVIAKNFRNGDDEANEQGVVAKTYVRFDEPFDVRHLTYLGIVYEGRPTDHFFYSPRTRIVRRFRLEGIGILGTDYTFDDIVSASLDDAVYERLPDGEFEGIPAYVVKANLKPHLQTRYRSVIAYLHREKYALLRQLFLGEDGDVLRELRADPETIEEFDGVFMPTASTMYDVKQGTHSRMIVDLLSPNPELPERVFSRGALRYRTLP